MPAIFTQQNRDELYRRMIDAGWDQLVRNGIRSLRVEQVAAAVGIAKGTFYHFFDSKDRNIFRIATAEEYRYLVRSLADERTLDPASDGALVRWIVNEVADARPGVDVAAVQNLQFALALTLLNRSLLRAEALERTVDALIDDTLDELFGRSG